MSNPSLGLRVKESDSALSWAGSICSVLGMVAVVVLQTFQFNNLTLLFWWITTAIIGIAAINSCFTPPSFPLRAVFAIVFVAQLPAFNWAWGEMYERDTTFGFGLSVRSGPPTDEEIKTEKKIGDLERENANLKSQWRQTLLFWQAISHLAGMGFALLGCTAAGQRRVRIIYEGG